MKKDRKATPEQRAAVARTLSEMRPDGEGWEAYVQDHRLAYRRKAADGSWEYLDVNDHPTNL